MTTETFIKGQGKTKTIKALGPTKRTDGSALPKDTIAGYDRYLAFNGGQPIVQRVVLVEDASTPEYDGAFDEVIDIDSHAPGTYEVWYRTVLTGDFDGDGEPDESVDSEIYTLVVSDPLAQPNPPTQIG